jgi:hypothetical protein
VAVKKIALSLQSTSRRDKSITRSPRRRMSGAQFTRAKRLGDIIIGPEFKPDDPVRFRSLCRQHDHRNASRAAVRAKHAAYVEPVDPWQHYIHQNHIGLRLGGHFQSGFAIRRAHDIETFPFEIVPDQLDEIFLVVDDENSSFSHAEWKLPMKFGDRHQITWQNTWLLA